MTHQFEPVPDDTDRCLVCDRHRNNPSHDYLRFQTEPMSQRVEYLRVSRDPEGNLHIVIHPNAFELFPVPGGETS